MNALIGQKSEQLQRFFEDGRRIPVTVIRVPEIAVVQLKTREKDGYAAAQLGIAEKKQTKATKPLIGHVKKSGAKTPLFLSEIRFEDEAELPELGTMLKAAEILEPGDIVWVTGTSKGKGFAGGVKRYGFKGGPRTHGQSDRERAPGSIGQTTTPGRVYRGKRMAGNMGNEQVTIKNLLVVSVNPDDNTLMIAGLVPGLTGGYVKIVKKGTVKNFTPLLKNPQEQAKADAEAAQAEAEAEAKRAEEAAAKEAAETAATEESTKDEASEPAAEPAVETASDIAQTTDAPSTDAPEETPTDEVKEEAK